MLGIIAYPPGPNNAVLPVSFISIFAVPATMKAQGKPRAVGLLVAKELDVIDGLMANPKRPLFGVMGGAKVSDKVKFITALLGKVDHLLIGGKMTYTFLKARGVSVGNMPIADEEVHVMLLEPKSTLNTGNVHNDRTLEQLERI